MNPFSQESVKAAVTQALAASVIPSDHNGVFLLAPTVVNGQLDIKVTAAERVGDHWEIGEVGSWHQGGDWGAGITVVGSW